MTRAARDASTAVERGRRMRQARRDARLTQAQLARATGVSLGAIRDLEQGRTSEPGTAVVTAVREVIGLDLTVQGPSTVSPERDVRIGVLGALRCIVAGHDVTPTGRLQATMLAIAAIHVGELIGDDTYADLMWPQARPRDIAAALHTHATRLRALLRGVADSTIAGSNDPGRSLPSLQRERQGYRLVVAPGSVDVQVFADLVRRAPATGDPAERVGLLLEALALWRGPVATDLPELAAHPHLAGWEQRRREVAVELVRCALGDGTTPTVGATAAVAAAEIVLGDHLLDEHLATGVVRLLVALGRPADALQVFGRVRAVLADELGAEPGPELRAAHAGALRPVTTGRPAVRRRWTPAELPRDIADFVGRDEEIAAARAELLRSDGLPGIVALVGMGGVGKSTLATRIAHGVRTEFPDGQLHLDLRGTDERPVPTARAVDLLLRRLDVGTDPADDAEARAALLRTALSRGRHLLVLDNARSAAHVRELLPSHGGSAALVTSRRSLVGLDGIGQIRLRTLPPAVGRAFVRRLVGARAADEPAVAGIAEACGYLPLALRLAVDHAVTARADLPTLHAALADSQTRWRVLRQGDRAVRASLELGWSSLDPRLRRALGDLASLPGGDVHLDAALAATGLPHDEGLVALSELSLLELREGRRVGMHDLVRAVVRELEPRNPHDPHGPVGRVVAWYSRWACAMTSARHPYRPQPSGAAPSSAGDGAPTRAAAVEWLDIEHPILLTLADAVIAGGAPFAWRLMFAVAMSCEDKEESARAIDVAQRALRLVDADDREAEAFLRLVLARAYGMSSRYPEARAALAALQDGRAAPLPPGLAVWLQEMSGLVLDSTGDQDAAAQHYARALQLARHHRLTEMEWSVLHNYADLEIARGRSQETLQLVERAAAVNAALGRRNDEHITANLGALAWLAGDHVRALDLLLPVPDQLLALQEVRAACEVMVVQAHAAVALGRQDVADAAATRALDVAVRHEDGAVFARVLGAVAVVEARWYDVDRAVDGLTHALSMARALNATATTIEILLAHSVGTLVAARPELVRSAAIEAERLARTIGNDLAAAKAVQLLAAVDTVPVPRP